MKNLLTFMPGLLLVTLFVMTGCNKPEKGIVKAYPNVVYILADDMGYGDISGLNKASKIRTPNMDKLLNEGMNFTDAHSPSAVCTPTRYGILTGRYCFRTRLESGVLVGHHPSLVESGRLTVASMLKEKGYNTACIGKWHLGLDFKKKDPQKSLVEGDWWDLSSTSNVDYDADIDGGPVDCGFDYSFIIPSSLDIQPYIYVRNKKVVNPDIIHIEGMRDENLQGKFWRHGDASRDFSFLQTLPILTDEAVQFISRQAQNGANDPFFLYFPLPAPHTPWMPLEEFQGNSGAGRYGDFVTQVDYTVGEILRVLDEKGMADNTLVILTSDNGAYWFPANIQDFEHRSNYVFSGMKSDVWEGGHHIPFIARWPGIISNGSSSDQLVCLTDLMATCADIVDYDLPFNSAEDSYSHLHALLGEENHQARDQLVMQSISGMYSIRKDNWKLILGRGSGGWTYEGEKHEPEGQLYDLSIDIEEKNNLYLQNHEKVNELMNMLNMFKEERRSR
jgi:arylsulfatase A-like enzyme